jgi:cell wall-associated NlpC family hydrolase
MTVGCVGRSAIVAEARSWEGTRWHHMGRVKIRRDSRGIVLEPGGVDCVQFVYLVFFSLGLTHEMPLAYYPEQWFLHRDADLILPEMSARGREVKSPLPGDVVVYRMGRSFGHAGIVDEGGWPNIIHANRLAGRVMQDRGDAGLLARRERKFFSIISE